MANNFQSNGAQLRPPAVGSMAPQSYAPPFPMQFRPAGPPQQGQHFIPPPSASQQFRPVGQPQNIGMPPGPAHMPQYSQSMQQFPPRPGQSGYAPSSQAVQMQYPMTSGPLQPQQIAQSLNNQGPGVGVGVPPFSSSYTFAPSSFGQPQHSMSSSPHFQSSSQVHAPIDPVGGQPWLHSGGQTAPVVTPLQQTSQTSAVAPSPSSASDWQEYEADGRRYYYNKITKQSSWEKPPELMTPLEMSWQVRGI